MASFLFFLSFFSLCEKNHLQHCLLLEARANQEKEKEIVPPFWFSFLSVRFSCVRFLSLWKLSSLGRFCSNSSFNDWCVMKMLRGDELRERERMRIRLILAAGAEPINGVFTPSLSSFPPLLSLSLMRNLTLSPALPVSFFRPKSQPTTPLLALSRSLCSPFLY